MKRQRFKVNNKYEVRFVDHSASASMWGDRDEILAGHKDLDMCLVGHYIGSTKKSYIFGMVYSKVSGNYSPTFAIVKKAIERWRKLRP